MKGLILKQERPFAHKPEIMWLGQQIQLALRLCENDIHPSLFRLDLALLIIKAKALK
ncbi:MAG: hypothetical protein LBV23_08515 [Deltaproteobacteria bacterium]|nr:hypothetical protein [Deltaproteobacteria bacterium]